MSDDPCEYFWSHELAMRRLLHFMRNGQTYCTDGECVDLTTGQSSSPMGLDNQFLMFTMIFVMAVLLYVLRPSATRRSDAGKPAQMRPADGGPDDSVPPAID